MMTRMRIWMVAALIACAGAALGQGPYVGYVYPAGGQQGTVFRVTLGGQRLRGVSEAYVSGKGVRGAVVNYQGASGPLSPAQQQELKQRLEEIRAERRGVDAAGKPDKTSAKPGNKAPNGANAARIELPDLSELRNLDQQTPVQLLRIADKFLNQQKRTKPPMAEEVTLEVTMDPDAAPGDREIRLRTPDGLTNPLVFQVGRDPETREPDRNAEKDASVPSPVNAPVVLNGQIMPGEVDHFRLRLRSGQRLAVAGHARKLIPYLADAVPGWFQAVVAVYDADGKELAYCDDRGYDPDPAFVFQVPRDGQYLLKIRDAIYRGREDFVYRVDVGEETPTKPPNAVISAQAQAVDGAPQRSEAEPNDTGQKAMRVTLPQVINGCISGAGDKDVFVIKGRAGDQVVAEVYARRAGSPLDSLLRLIDTKGRVVAMNDDSEDKASGLLTHHADSYLSAKLPATGDYFVQISDAQRHGGAEYDYSLRIGPPQPDFALRVTPSSLSLQAGRAVTITAYALRKDGWDGDIEIALKDAPPGFALSGARIPKGRDKVRMTLTAPLRGRFDQPVALNLEGRAQIGGKTVTRPAVPAQNMMQAFAYQHLVPSEQLMVAVKPGGRGSPSLDISDGDRVRIPAGGSTKVAFSMSNRVPTAQVRLELSDPPAGVSLQEQSLTSDGFTAVVKADDKHIGYTDNLILEMFTEVDAKNKKGGPAQKKRQSLGVLPAVPFEIVRP